MLSPTIERLWHQFTSTGFALILFGTLSVLSLLGTLPGLDGIYQQPLFRVIVGMLGLCTFACSLRRWRTMKWPVLVIHSGVIITLAGGMTSWLGYVATVNAYEGDRVDRFYRWDLEQDVTLGFNLTIKRINADYFPVPVKIGVMRGEEKKDLFILKTGESFNIDKYNVRAERLEPFTENISLTVFENGKSIGMADTEGKSDLPAAFPYSFKLVAYKNPVMKRMWVDLALEGAGFEPVAGTSEVNAPLQWQGVSFFCTQIARDPQGRQYAGIQVVKDPGRPLVFGGMLITSIGALCAFARRKVWG